jgi:N-acetylneuraminic acid mutarotase
MSHFTITRRIALLGGAAGLLSACAKAQDTKAPGNPAAPKGWQMGPDLPYELQEIYPALHKGQIHLAGGFLAANGEIIGPTAEHQALNPDTGVWAALAPLPTPRHHPHLISFKDKLYAIGGFESAPEAVWQMQSMAWVYDDAGDAWLDAPALPAPRGEAVTTVIGEGLHFAGGREQIGTANAAWSDHVDTNTHWRFDGSAWQAAAPLPTARNSAAAAMIGENWHVVGGRTVANGNTPAHEVYDAKEDRWRTVAPMPQGQAGLAAASIAGKLYAFGGEFFDNGGGVYPESWVYDPITDSWAAIPDMPSPRHGLGGVAVGEGIYLIGGALKVGGSETTDIVEIYTP